MKRRKVIKMEKYNYEPFVDSKKKLIIKGFEMVDDESRLRRDTITDNNVNKLILAAIGCAVLYGLTSALNLSFSIFLLCGAGATAISALVVMGENFINKLISRHYAHKKYAEVKSDCDGISNFLHREVTPALSPYLMQYIEGEELSEHKDVIIKDNLTDQPMGPDVVSVPLENDQIIVGEIDNFLSMALQIDSIIFLSQYDGCAYDIEKLQILIRNYINDRPCFTKTSEHQPKYSERTYYKYLGYLYAKVLEHKEEYEMSLDKDVLVRLRRLEDQMKRD